MARMRTVKPEFWEDEVVGCLSREARLLFIATWNLADDEGLLRWTPSYLKANVFMYDDDISNATVELLMKELVNADVLFPYVAGKARQQLAYVVNFHRHQRPNRPQPSKLPPPSIQAGAVIQMYGRRDGMVCHLCKGDIVLDHDREREWLSLDHLVPRSKGGTDYPSNIKAAHVSCNKARRDRPIESFRGSPATRGQNDSVNDSVNDAHERDASFTAGVVKGVVKGEGEGRGKKNISSEIAARSPDADESESVRDDVERVCTHLADRIESNGSKRPTITGKWRDAARLMIDRDRRTEEQIHHAIDWCQDNEFWRSNVLSMPKLRDKYDQLSLQARRERERASPNGTRSTADDRVAQAQALKAEFRDQPPDSTQPRQAIPGEVIR